MNEMSFGTREVGSLKERGEPKLLEEVIQEKVVFKEIDIREPKNKYHEDMLQGLLVAEDGEVSLIRQVLMEKGLDNGILERVVVASIIIQHLGPHQFTARICDVEYVRADEEGMAQEKDRVRRLLEPLTERFDEGFREIILRA